MAGTDPRSDMERNRPDVTRPDDGRPGPEAALRPAALAAQGALDRPARRRLLDALDAEPAGLTVAALISIIAPLTQCCLNPARDFGPRLFTYFAGWGTAALPGPNGHGFFTVYILAPILGAAIGGGIYERLIGPAFVSAPLSEP